MGGVQHVDKNIRVCVGGYKMNKIIMPYLHIDWERDQKGFQIIKKKKKNICLWDCSKTNILFFFGRTQRQIFK